jgi:gamma-glutamyltranspeptidase / glutathione hydrolase
MAEGNYTSSVAHSALGGNAGVATSHSLASEVGQKILRNGGNAIDAAAAIGYTLAVVNPCCGNIGGGGFMTIHLASGKETFIDFRETAPSGSTRDMFSESGRNTRKSSTEGYLAVGVPGTVKGLEYARVKYGKMPRQKVLSPAIELAEKGFTLGQGDISLLEEGSHLFNKYPNTAKSFLKDGVSSFHVGDKLLQKNLASTLTLISRQGESAFYKGSITDEIIAASNQNNGILTKADFREYKVKESSPIKCEYREYVVLTAPLPGGGLTLCQMLNILEGYNLRKLGYHSTPSLHYMLASMLFAYSDRNSFFADPDFVHIQTKNFLSKEYAKSIRMKIQNKAISPDSIHFNTHSGEGNNTTHYSIKDKFGNAVSVTYTINSYFGSGVIAGNTGFILNNEMDDFTTSPGKSNSYSLIQGQANQVEPGKRPLSSMSPTIVLLNNKPVIITGSPGGSTIPNTVLQVLLNIIDYDMSLKDAVASPRLHYQGSPDFVVTEPYALSNDVFQHLWELGYKVVPYSSLGVADSIYIDPKINKLNAVSDYRRSSGQGLAY